MSEFQGALQSILDSLDDQIVIIDLQGDIQYMNQSWKQFNLKNDGHIKTVHQGNNYLEGLQHQRLFNYEGIKDVLTNKMDDFALVYSNHEEDSEQFFRLKINRCLLPNGQTGALIQQRDVTKEVQSEKTEMQIAVYENTNLLTSLPNRKAIREKIITALKNRVDFTTLHLDIDGFKNINELYSHETGDKLLVQIAGRFNREVQPYGQLAHLGGDEFLIFMENKPRDTIEEVVEGIVGCLKYPIRIEGHEDFNVTVSIGISQSPQDGTDINHLLSAAETAMYQAKAMADSHHCFYEMNMTEELSKRITIERSLLGDLSEEGIYFILQPQLNGQTKELVGFEVLCRWNHAKLGPLSPLDFINIVESSGHMPKLTRYLMEEIFSQVSKWMKDFGFNKRISINVTSSLLSKELFFNDLYELLTKYEIPYEYIELEITEETRLVTSTQMLKHIQQCREKGIRIAIDDFGTGFSMLASLTHFPIDKIKIDKYFIQRIGNNSQFEAVLKSIIHLSKGLSCDLVAEGVENEHEIDFLMEHGCHFFQGYYYERPISIHDFQQKYMTQAV